LTLANEGKAIIFAAPEAAEAILNVLHNNPLGKNAALVGYVEKSQKGGRVIMETLIGTKRLIEMPVEAGLPRIC
jgi:hydrogenase expression/formation protein HypE